MFIATIAVSGYLGVLVLVVGLCMACAAGDNDLAATAPQG
jgi:hypothetical protein